MATVLEKEAVRELPKSPLTYEQFLEWADEDTYAEWVDGKVELMSPASRRHQKLALYLGRLLGEFEELGFGEVFIAPFQMRLANVRRGREPDVIFVVQDNLSYLQNNYLDGPADLAIEIISPESAGRDRGAKYAEYEAGGVREYWIIDADARQVNFFVRDETGRYQPALPDAEGKYESAVLPGFWIRVDWLWQTPLLPVSQAREAWQMEKGPQATV